MTGIEFIARERAEQLEKHGITTAMDVENYTKDELRYAAIFCLTLHEDWWPKNWDEDIRYRVERKTMIERESIAGALLAADIDRLQVVGLSMIRENYED